MALQKYPNQEKLKEIFKEKIIFSLKEENLYSAQKNDPNVFEADFSINYVRAFMAFTSDKYAGSSLEGYKIKVIKNEELIANRSNNQHYFVNQGLLGNLKKIAKNLTLSGNENDELKEINAFADGIAKDLKMLGK